MQGQTKLIHITDYRKTLRVMIYPTPIANVIVFMEWSMSALSRNWFFPKLLRNDNVGDVSRTRGLSVVYICMVIYYMLCDTQCGVYAASNSESSLTK